MSQPPQSVKRRKAAVINLIFNYGNSALAIVSGIILVPFYLRNFDMGTYGAWLASGNILGMLGLLEFGFNLVFCQRLSEASGALDNNRFVLISGSGMIITFGSAVLVCGLGVGFSQWIPTWINSPQDQTGALSIGIAMAAVGAAATIVYLGFGAIVQAWQETFFAGLTMFVSSLAGILATIIGLWIGMGVSALGLGGLVKGVLASGMLGVYVVIIWRRKKLARPQFKLNETMDLIKTSVPVFAGRTGGVVLSNSEEAIVSVFINPESAAVLSLTRRVYQTALILISPLGSSAFAGIAHLVASAPIARVREVVKELLAIIMIAMAMLFGPALALNEGFMNIWVGSKSFGGFGLNIALCVSMMLVSYLNFVGLILTATGEVGKTAWCSLADLAIRLPIMYILLSRFGLIGLPLSAIASSIAISLPYQSVLLFKRLAISITDGVRMMSASLLALIITLGLGLLANLALIFPSPANWSIFAGQFLSVCIVTFGTILLTSKLARNKIMQVSETLTKNWV